MPIDVELHKYICEFTYTSVNKYICEYTNIFVKTPADTQ